MKSRSKKNKKKVTGFITLFILLGAPLVWLGCQTKVSPVGAYSAPATTANPALVIDFKGNLNPTPEPTNQTNSHLFELGAPNNQVVSPGTWAIVNNFTQAIPHVTPSTPYEGGSMTITGGGPGGPGDNACFITGFVNDKGDGTYPAIELAGLLDNSPPNFPVPTGQKSAYNAAFFSGVKFYVNIKPDDTAAARYFYVATTQEAAPPSGTCTGATGCYNYFGYTFPGPTNGWQLVTKNFQTDLVTSYGFVPSPPTFTGVNLQEVFELLWEEGDANGGKTVNVDFGVDDVYFY